MRSTKIKSKPGNSESRKYYWKRRPSEIRGYNRTLYLNADNGDYIRVDYNTKEKRVRLYVEDSEEGGIPYYAVISNGKITAEKNAQSGRPHDLKEKFSMRSDIFSTIGNREILKLINKNYGIGDTRESAAEKEEKRRIALESTRKRYFKSEDHEVSEYRGAFRRALSFSLVDVLDTGIGAMLTAGIYILLDFDYVSAGIAAAFFGIIIGMVDIVFRRKEPFFPKVIAFILAGVALYVYGYYFR